MENRLQPRSGALASACALTLALLCGLASPAWAGFFSPKNAPPAAGFSQEIDPLLQRYCQDCHNPQKHKGGLSLQGLSTPQGLRQHRDTWTEILSRVRKYQMPPEGVPQPSEPERERLAARIEAALFPVDPKHPDPGRVTLRRLNRAEYNLTVRDLTGIDFQPADDFPTDDSGYGFDNIGDALSVSPLLLEKYLAAAEKVIDAATQPATNGVVPAGYRRIFSRPPEPGKTNECVRATLGDFARRAFRRPVAADELDRLSRLVEESLRRGAGLEDSLRAGLTAILVSPHFLFRGELQPSPDDPRVVRPVDEYALASRLSYFLWSTMPDDELFALADKGKLRASLEAQVRRMLASPRSAALVRNFAGQWLQLRNLKFVAPDPKLFPQFDEDLRLAMETESERFFEHILRQDRSVLEFLTADYSFLNERLARHYRIAGVSGPEFRQVALLGTRRGGILTQASVLTVTSNPTRTSPVKRGKWVLENLLAQPPPPPPPGVPPLAESGKEAAGASLRQRMERHRSDPMCASCHARMDPIGFGLENFDAIGAWRDQDADLPIDASGELNGGERFNGASGLRDLLVLKQRAAFVRCLAEKLLTYALGRGLEYYDRPAVDEIVARVNRQNGRFSAIILGVVESAPFQLRRGEGDPFANSR